MGDSKVTTNGVSVVVPVYNSERTLPELVERVHAVLAARGEPFEMVLVNDGSRDGSWQRIVELARIHPWIRGLNLMRNYGQHSALLCGTRAATLDVIVTVDDDLQHPPEHIPTLLEHLSPEVDVVYGCAQEQRHGLWRNLASRWTKIALGVAIGLPNVRRVSAFRAFRTHVREAFADYRGSDVALDVLLSWGTTRFGAVEVPHAERRYGRSNYSLLTLIVQAVNLLTGYSALPLRFASLAGMAFTVFGGLVLAYVVLRYLIEGYSVPGFPFLASIIAIFSGVQLFSLGIIGEYIARIFYRTMDHPPYTVAQRTRQE